MASNESRRFAAWVTSMAQPQRSRNEDYFSQSVSEDFHLVLARDDHHQRRDVCDICAHAADADSPLVARSHAGWTKRAKGRGDLRTIGRGWFDVNIAGDRKVVGREWDVLR